MPRIISVSRRTDIPAFYGDWFMNRLKEGFAGYVNPFGGQKYTVSLKPEDVSCFVFWSKNFKPFIEKLKVIEDLGYKFYFNYTITGLPKIFECNEKEIAIEALKELSNSYSTKHINWRYDPIIISEITDYDFHIRNFENIASVLEGHVERCIISYVFRYGKVKRNFEKLRSESGINVTDPDNSSRIKLANEFADIAARHGITMFSCCGDYLLGHKIAKAHCVDGKLIEELFYEDGFRYGERPTRKECGCTESVDIGAYDTCPHGCIYCYANTNKKVAEARFRSHDRSAAFLGYTKVESDKWVKDIKGDNSLNSTLSDYP
ncbi:MAG: DUF1848 domain-containing protein [Candidatus Methanoperedens sp.]|nr:DUF1848 domain-containing protein [Candidatus Methanoperedens sp.]MCZ7371002.1 DUF1848 domain-containing protein [Candidatus Methanoperedens sp.]